MTIMPSESASKNMNSIDSTTSKSDVVPVRNNTATICAVVLPDDLKKLQIASFQFKLLWTVTAIGFVIGTALRSGRATTTNNKMSWFNKSSNR
jgi:hypothetical protein